MTMIITNDTIITITLDDIDLVSTTYDPAYDALLETEVDAFEESAFNSECYYF